LTTTIFHIFFGAEKLPFRFGVAYYTHTVSK